jgi:hypothetical protein
MNSSLAKISLLSLALFGSSLAAADNPPQRHYVSEDQLRLFCTPKAVAEDALRLSRALCQNYVLGVVDGHDAWTGISKNSKRAFCLPEGTFNAQLTDAVVAVLMEKTPTKSGIGAFLVLEGLNKAFPCKVDPK